VDNVAGLYGGSRDAPLTSHGALQAQLLASGLLDLDLQATHIFSSNLERAAKTAKAICDAQNKAHRLGLTVVQLPELREKHFGNWEGVKFAPGPLVQRPTQTGAETMESLKARANAFLEQHLAPLLTSSVARCDKSCVVVVSHGISLGILTLALAKKLSAVPGDGGGLGQLTSTRLSWSNTGYLHLAITAPRAGGGLHNTVDCPPGFNLAVQVVCINGTAHLNHVRKTRGGIGSAAHDEKQMTLDRYFGAPSRKRKASDA
jgi:broad specificity phosphatase PhoE